MKSDMYTLLRFLSFCSICALVSLPVGATAAGISGIRCSNEDHWTNETEFHPFSVKHVRLQGIEIFKPEGSDEFVLALTNSETLEADLGTLAKFSTEQILKYKRHNEGQKVLQRIVINDHLQCQFDGLIAFCRPEGKLGPIVTTEVHSVQRVSDVYMIANKLVVDNRNFFKFHSTDLPENKPEFVDLMKKGIDFQYCKSLGQ
jgi:hypothetical protein